MRFQEKVVLVTGGGGVIGRTTSGMFAAEGARVVVTDASVADGEATVRGITDGGGRAMFVKGDVTDPASVAAIIQAAVREYGRLDCAFNNAGMNLSEDNDWNPAAFEKLMAVNTTGVMYCMKYEIEAMLQNGGGTIVNNASVNGLVGSPLQPGYAASKHAVVGLTRTGALRYARQNIRVNAVCPGATRSVMTSKAMAISEEVSRLITNMAPMGRLAEPEEVGEAVLWLCSRQSSFVTGHALAVDGGYVAG